jgi:hypothetical protein
MISKHLPLSINTPTEQQRPPTASTTEDNQTEIVRQLLKRVDALESQIKILKDAKKPAPDSTEAPPSQSAASKIKSSEVPEAESSNSESGINEVKADQNSNGLPGFQMRGFSNVDWQADPTNAKSKIFVGNVDLLINSRLSEKLSVLAELNIEGDSSGEFVIDPERLLLQYEYNNYFNLSVGKYHIANGYYNSVYHHGKWFETAATRPRIMEFEDKGGPLPIHNIGLTVTGQIPSGNLGLHYIAQLGNGGTSQHLRADLPQDPLHTEPQKGKSYLVGMFARPTTGLQIGGSLYHDSYELQNSTNISGTIFNAHVALQRPEFEFLNEFFYLRHAERNTTNQWNSYAFYSLISHRINKYRPYFRYEFLNFNRNDPFWGDIKKSHGASMGVRYELSDFAALKFEYQRLIQTGRIRSNGLTLQLAFTF